MKNKSKSRSGCRRCKIRRLRCDETKPGCKNCLAKNLECPGYQQRLQWSTKHERSFTRRALGPSDFEQLVTAATQSIAEEGQGKRVASSPRPAIEPAPEDRIRTRQKLPTPPVESPSQVFEEQDDAVEEVEVVPGSALVASPPKSGEDVGLSLPRPLVDIPTFLIQHWFKTVCPSWSAFDSQGNPYRVLTWSLWDRSLPVYHALQAISAASLVVRLPLVMQEPARAAPRLAIAAIKQELMAFSADVSPKFPKELLLSLFCISSSLCWMEVRQLGLQFVRQARAVLQCLHRRRLEEEEQKLLDFFNGCLIYEEMLRSVVSNDEIDFQNMLSWPEPECSPSIVLAVPHAWTGVSSEVLRLFGKSITLCRKSRNRFQHCGDTTYRALQGAMMDIAQARQLEESLLAIEIAVPEDMGAEDALAINSKHLRDATDAYRLSALLQLYLTFPDLIATRIPSQVNADGSVAWSAWVTPLALHIARLLESIPSNSMSCIQPLLCLCAGTGLRLENKGPYDAGEVRELGANAGSELPSIDPMSAGFDLLGLGGGISESALKTTQARHFIMDRLRWLELSLPPKPIGVAKDLLRTMWATYDQEMETNRRTHWIDVMISNGLQSLFG